MFRLIRDNDQEGIDAVLTAIGEAETKRGEDMIKYCEAAKDFFKEMKSL